MNKKVIENYIAMMDQAEEKMKKEIDYPAAEEILNEVISGVEDSAMYCEDAETNTDNPRFPYSRMYRLKADALCTNTECVKLMEESYKWNPADYENTRELMYTYCQYGLIDKAFETGLKAFRYTTEKEQELGLFFHIRLIGDGNCWKIAFEEDDNEEIVIGKMNPESFADDFEPLGIPVCTDDIRKLSDEQISDIVRKCFPEEKQMIDITPKSAVRNHKDKCPYCGETRYFVIRADATSYDEYGNATFHKEGGSLCAYCFRCRTLINVPWVKNRNEKENEKRREEYEYYLDKAGYEKHDEDDVMEKYGIERRDDLSDIIVLSGMALKYSDDYDEGYDMLVRDLYDVPAIMCICIEELRKELEKIGMNNESDIERMDKYYKTASELSKQPCTNLLPIYGVTPTVVIDSIDEPLRFYINGVEIEESLQDNDPSRLFKSLYRAIDKYNEITGENDN